jgi:hypothetical protein
VTARPLAPRRSLTAGARGTYRLVAMTPRRAFVPTMIAAALLPLLAGVAGAQPLGEAPGPEAGPPILTVLSNPPNVSLSLSGPAEVYGRTPMDLPSSVVGRFSLLAEGGGVAKTQGVFAFSPRGEAPYCLSEPPGMSAGLLIRSLNYPGIPAMTVKRPLRGFPMSVAATGALVQATRAHLHYRDRLDEPGVLSGLRARGSSTAPRSGESARSTTGSARASRCRKRPLHGSP